MTAKDSTAEQRSTSILKGPGVQARTLLVRNSYAERMQAAAGVSAAAAAQQGAGRPPQSPAALLEEARAESARLLEFAKREAARLAADAQAEANRLLGQAQVELGRAREEAESVRQQAQARLEEAGEIIETAAAARALLAQNQEAARELIAGAEAEISQSFTTAREEGLEEGQRAGREEGARLAREELQHELELAHGVAAQAKVDREQLLAAAEPAIIRLAIATARRIISREVELDPDITRGLLTRAMLKAAGDDRIRLRLNPKTIETLGDYLANMTARFADRGVEVVADPAVEPAGVIVDTRAGTVDAQVETQLANVERTMLALTGEQA